MDDLISVIIPIYNSVQYIEGCIESVLAQTYTCLEILLVDDGSCDSAKKFYANLCKKDDRIRLVCQRHKGVSAARNKGIKVAKGKYLFFLDSDDAIHPELIGTLYRLQEKYQTAVSTESRYYASGGLFQKPVDWDRKTISEFRSVCLSCEEAIQYLLWGNQEATLYVIGGKMIRRDSLDDVRFDENLSHGEDTLFLYQMLAKGADVIIFPYDWYYYRIHADGASRVYSIETIQSRYKAEDYISDCEIKNNRMHNAVYWEQVMVDLLMEWQIESWNNKDEDMRKFVRALADSEKKLPIFSKISKGCKLRFYLAFNIYPLYLIIHISGMFLIHLYSRLVKCGTKTKR